MVSFAPKSTLAEMNKATSVFSSLVFAWNVPQSFPSKPESLYLNPYSRYIVGSCFSFRLLISNFTRCSMTSISCNHGDACTQNYHLLMTCFFWLFVLVSPFLLSFELFHLICLTLGILFLVADETVSYYFKWNAETLSSPSPPTLHRSCLTL
jgi:hypothetical protein